MILTDVLLLWIACFVFFGWYEKSPYVLGAKKKYGKLKRKLINKIKGTV